MSEPTFDIAFYGIIQPGKDKESVIENTALLFKTTPDKIRSLFAGGRRVIKSGVDANTAEKYRAALDNVGLVVKLEALQTAPHESLESGGPELTAAPVGADVLENPPVVEAQPIGDISHISMAEVGADVLENPPVVEARPIGDISHLSMAEVGADVLENPPVVEAQPIGDISHISMAEVGADLREQPKPSAHDPDKNRRPPKHKH